MLTQPVEMLMKPGEMKLAIRKMAYRIIEKYGEENPIVVGLRRRGVPVANRINEEIGRKCGKQYSLGVLDATLYRDDLTTTAPVPIMGPTKLPLPIDDRIIILVDAIVDDGRRIRAALDALIDFGRPGQVVVAAFLETTHEDQRDMPIHVGITGKVLYPPGGKKIKVKIDEEDGEDAVILLDS